MPTHRPWSDRSLLTFAPPDSTQPALLVIGDTLHLVFVSSKTLYHARLLLADPAAQWLSPVRFASGEAPALASTPDGKLHCAFTHWFLGNCEVYHASWNGQQWSLPELVSRTGGVSTSPALAAGPDGSLHVVWADTTPGRSTVYYGQQRDIAWTSGPIPNGEGSRPALVIGPKSEVIVAWQDRLSATGCYEIFSAERKSDAWSLPRIVSGTPERHSLYPHLAINPGGDCHLVWQEESGRTYAICGAARLRDGWGAPASVSEPGTDCRLGRVVARAADIFQAFWACGSTLKHRGRPTESRAYWWQAETVDATCDGISDLAVALGPNGDTYAVWSAYFTGDQRQLWYASREPVPMQGIFIPMESGPMESV